MFYWIAAVQRGRQLVESLVSQTGSALDDKNWATNGKRGYTAAFIMPSFLEKAKAGFIVGSILLPMVQEKCPLLHWLWFGSVQASTLKYGVSASSTGICGVTLNLDRTSGAKYAETVGFLVNHCQTLMGCRLYLGHVGLNHWKQILIYLLISHSTYWIRYILHLRKKESINNQISALLNGSFSAHLISGASILVVQQLCYEDAVSLANCCGLEKLSLYGINPVPDAATLLRNRIPTFTWDTNVYIPLSLL